MAITCAPYPEDHIVSAFEHTYSDEGLRTACVREDGATVEFDYNELGRLTDEWKKDSSNDTVYRRKYSYDLSGNRTQLVRSDLVSSEIVDVTETLEYNGLGELATREFTIDSTAHQELYGYDNNGSLTWKQELSGSPLTQDATWCYEWDAEKRMTKVVKWTGVPASETKSFEIEYRYCPSCSGALSARIKKDGDGDIVSWLRYEYSGLQLLRIDEVCDADSDGTLEDPADDQDAWRILNLYVHSGSSLPISAKWFSYRTPNSGIYCDTGTYYYMYDAVGNVNGVVQDGNYYRWEMDAFGNDLNGGNSFLPMNSPGATEHLHGKMYDVDTGLYYFITRWHDPELGRYISRNSPYAFADNDPVNFIERTAEAPAEPAPTPPIDPNPRTPTPPPGSGPGGPATPTPPNPGGPGDPGGYVPPPSCPDSGCDCGDPLEEIGDILHAPEYLLHALEQTLAWQAQHDAWRDEVNICIAQHFGENLVDRGVPLPHDWEGRILWILSQMASRCRENAGPVLKEIQNGGLLYVYLHFSSHIIMAYLDAVESCQDCFPEYPPMPTMRPVQ